MSQQIFSDIDPEVTTGLMLAALLDDFKDALMSGVSGTSRPTQISAGGLWIDTSQEGAPTYRWTLKLFNGTTDLTVFDVDVISGFSGFNKADASFTIRRAVDDSVGAILNLIKSRIASSGQVKEDDNILRVNFVGRTAEEADPVVASLQTVAAEDMDSLGRGVVFSFASTPAGTNSASEHLRMELGKLISVMPHKFNALIYGQETVSGTENMLIPDDKIVTEVTGDDGEKIHGIEAEDSGSKYKIIVNAGTSNLNLLSESEVVTAEERLKINKDIVLIPGGLAVLYYCANDLRWKIISYTSPEILFTVDSFNAGTYSWVARITGQVKVVSTFDEVEPRSRMGVYDVVEGNSYDIVVDAGSSYFGNNYVGQNLKNISIGYIK